MKTIKEFDGIVHEIISSDNEVGDVLKRLIYLDIDKWKDEIFEFRNTIRRPSSKAIIEYNLFSEITKCFNI